MSALLVALGAAVGAPLRFWVVTRLDDDVPWGTLAVNVAGSLVLGLLVAASVDGGTYALLGVGFCGGLTTYSAFAVQTVRLGRRGAAYAAGTIVASVGAAALGWWVGQWVGR
ncbi:CrcB family protein [Nocardioides dongxiaopingii]|uniref:fluoride efflux transporter FluC n=1 Tax=Nocardioides sp. S-1144 TaxID=2582905 RepID=UPI00110EB5D9|nr:CrcB family protein [Nocardioides sp. S-1144]QCW51889.1 CrcB family protein [Nocardioides sp. S-1144]